MRKLLFAAVVGASLLAALVGGSFALAKNDKGGGVRAKLIGYNEVPSVSTAAKGKFRATIDHQDTIEYELSYAGIEGGTAVAGHIHLGQRHTNGGVSAFLCGGGDKPACPSPGGTVKGTIDAADVIGPAGQGIAAGQIDELIRAIRAGATYANVHSTVYPGGEIRGQVKGGKGKGGGGDHDDDRNDDHDDDD
ncbi:MAG: CHRD domain-containing protein [Gaiellaceae bacterium MAG52_C11]|nr:CHRD domain-containing protein [Candidatus Gaiellasilicea maunaloa]